MEVNKLSRNDWIVLAGFVLTIIGLSFPWYSVSVSISVLGSSIGVSTSGWHGLGILIFLLTLIAAAVVLLKTLPSISFKLPFPEPLVVMALGALSVLFVLIRFLQKPSSPVKEVHVGYGFGIFLTLIAVAIITFGGFLKNSES